jgi:hypothetical protein
MPLKSIKSNIYQLKFSRFIRKLRPKLIPKVDSRMLIQLDRHGNLTWKRPQLWEVGSDPRFYYLVFSVLCPEQLSPEIPKTTVPPMLFPK